MASNSYVSACRVRCFSMVALASFVVMVGAGPARAADPSRDAKQEAKARFVAGQSHYNLNEYTEALREFKEAYRLYPDPVFLFNLGQCERQLDHYEEAIRFYRSFLREQPKAPNRQDVLHRIEEMEVALKARETQEKDGPVTPPPSLEPKVAVPSGPPAPAVPSVPSASTGALAAPALAPAAPPAATPESSAAAFQPAAPPVSAEPTGSATAAIDLSTAPAPEPEAGRAPIYKRWWFWTAAAAVAIGAGVGIYAATASDGLAVPSSVLGSRRVF